MTEAKLKLIGCPSLKVTPDMVKKTLNVELVCEDDGCVTIRVSDEITTAEILRITNTGYVARIIGQGSQLKQLGLQIEDGSIGVVIRVSRP